MTLTKAKVYFPKKIKKINKTEIIKEKTSIIPRQHEVKTAIHPGSVFATLPPDSLPFPLFALLSGSLSFTAKVDELLTAIPYATPRFYRLYFATLIKSISDSASGNLPVVRFAVTPKLYLSCFAKKNNFTS